jgi:hypothetical protein
MRSTQPELTMTNIQERSDSSQEERNACQDLEQQYRQIGIPALAAALRFQGERSATADQRKRSRPQPGGQAA